MPVRKSVCPGPAFPWTPRDSAPMRSSFHVVAPPLLVAILLWITGGCASAIRLDAPATAPPQAGPPAVPSPPAESQTSERPFVAAWLEQALRPKRVAWRNWGAAHLQTGDLVFTRGNYYLLLGAINFSDFLSTVTESPFSHVGIVAIEDGQAVVYDISDPGIRCTPFERYVTRRGYRTAAVRRPVPMLYAALPKTLRFVREQQASGVAFDRQFRSGNPSLYCSEMIVDAFSTAGVEIAEPVRAGDLPGLGRVGPLAVSWVRFATGLAPDDHVHIIGSASTGLYGSPWLVEVLPPTEI